MKTSPRPLLAAAAALALLSPNAADAVTVSSSPQTFNIFAPQVLAGPISNETLIIPQGTTIVSLPFERFDTSRGTLVSVDWEYEFNFEIAGIIGSGGGSLGGGVSGGFFLDPARDAGLGAFGGTGNGNGNFRPDEGPLSVGFSVQGSDNLSTFAIGPNLDFFSAPGGGQHQIDWLFGEDVELEAENASDVTLTLLDGFSTLTFNFTPAPVVPEPITAVPEPITAVTGLMGLSVLGMSVLRRRQRG